MHHAPQLRYRQGLLLLVRKNLYLNLLTSHLRLIKNNAYPIFTKQISRFMNTMQSTGFLSEQQIT